MTDKLEAPLVRGESDLLVFISSVMTEEMKSVRRKAVQTLHDLPFSRPWAFEYTPANSEDVTDAYLRKVEEADFVIWLVGVDTTQPARRQPSTTSISAPCGRSCARRASIRTKRPSRLARTI